MTTPGSPIWQPFDPSQGSLPESLSQPPHEEGDAGAVVAVVASGGATHHQRGPRAAFAIARAWAAEGARIMLADLGLERPSLHGVAQVENGEGMSDVFLFGASIHRIARPVDGGAFFLAPAGTVTASPEEVLEHPRWEALVEGFGSASAILLLYVPADDVTLPGVLNRSGGVILLGEEGSDPSQVLGAAEERLLGALSLPMDPEGAEREGAGEPGPSRRDEARVAPESGEGSASRAAEAREEEAAMAVAEGVAATGDGGPERAGGSPPARHTTLWILVAVVLVIAGVLAAAWLGYLQIPGLDLTGSGGP